MAANLGKSPEQVEDKSRQLTDAEIKTTATSSYKVQTKISNGLLTIYRNVTFITAVADEPIGESIDGEESTTKKLTG